MNQKPFRISKSWLDLFTKVLCKEHGIAIMQKSKELYKIQLHVKRNFL